MASRPPRCARPDGTTKAAFRSRAKANQAVRRERGLAGVPLYVYECAHCGYWHTTAQPQRVTPADHVAWKRARKGGAA